MEIDVAPDFAEFECYAGVAAAFSEEEGSADAVSRAMRLSALCSRI